MRAGEGRRGGQERDWTPNISLGLPVLIPEDYVRDLPVRLGLYRRIGGLASDAETEAMAAELVDRFGPLPQEVENLLQVVALKRACREAGVEKLEAGPKGMVLSFRGNAFSNPAGLVAWLASKGGLVRLRPDHKLAIVARDGCGDAAALRARHAGGAGRHRGAGQGSVGWTMRSHSAIAKPVRWDALHSCALRHLALRAEGEAILRRTHDAHQREPHPDHTHRQPAAARRTDRAVRPALARRGDRPRRTRHASARRRCTDVVAKQIAAGIDVGNNGEQQREAFFLYVRHRMSGFGGGWTRRVFADVTHYPAFSAWKAAHDAVNESVSNTGGVPEAVGEVRYLDRALVEAECHDFRAALDAAQGGFAEPFMTAPSPGIIAAAMRNVWYNTEDAYLAALGQRLAGGVRDDRRARLPAADRRAGPGDGAPPVLPGPPAGRLRRISSNAWWRRSTARWSTSRAIGSACTPAGATTKDRTTATWRCRRSCRRSRGQRWAASCCRSPIRATRTSIAA